MKNFKDVQIGDVLESWCAGDRYSYCVIAKKTEKKKRTTFNNENKLTVINQEITTLKVVESNCRGTIFVETISDELGDAKYYELTDHYDLTLE